VLSALEPGEHIKHLLITHTHSDHSPASRALQKFTEAPTYGFGPHGPVGDEAPILFGDAEADGDLSSRERREGADRTFRPDVVLADGDVVEDDGWSLEAVHTPGHASNHLCYLLREEAVLCSGDHVMGWSTSVISPPDGHLGDYLASLEKLLERPQDRHYLPTHGPQISEPHPLVRAFLAHRRERSEQILDALAAGPATIVELVPRLYADVSKRLWRGAAASIYAHVLYLHERGLVDAQDGAAVQLTSRLARRS
jgi:glyoxylase-like metal-dependent hydrolase (beta-lactamase superfamily II)